MAAPSLEKLAEIVLEGRPIYSAEIDGSIREIANRLSFTAFLNLCAHLDDESADFADALATFANALPRDNSYVIGFGSSLDCVPEASDDETNSGATSEPCPEPIYLKFTFDSVETCVIQDPIFPDMDAEYIVCGGRRRSGAEQFVRLELSNPAYLQSFLDKCRRNPFLAKIEPSTRDEFSGFQIPGS